MTMNHAYRFVTGAFVALIIATFFALPAGAQSSRSSDRYGCEDLETYFDVFFGAVDPDDQDAIELWYDTEDPFTLRRSQLEDIASAMDRWATNLEDVDPETVPLVTREHLAISVDFCSTLSNIYYLLSEGAGALDLMMYTETIEDLNRQYTEVRLEGERVCGELWLEWFNPVNAESTPAAKEGSI